MIKGKLYKDRVWQHHHYIELQESTRTMAREAECGRTTIQHWLHKFNIPTRPPGARRNYLDLSNKLSDLLEGELLGDGYVGMNSSRSALYSHGSEYEEYLIWLSRTLADMGLEQVGKIGKRWSKKGNAFGYHYTSRSYPELVPLRQRFYPKGKKIVPQDLTLTPIMARQWYIGDGGLYNRAKGRPCIDFSTHDFDRASIDHLLKELGDQGFKVTHRLARNTIGMSVHSVEDFLDWIGPCPISCYQYKWDYQDNRKSTSRQNS